MLSLVLPLLCAGHPLWMDCGGWLFVSSTGREAHRRTVCKFVTLTAS
jgi:hypothetical protein